MKTAKKDNRQIVAHTLAKILKDLKEVYGILGLFKQEPEKFLSEMKVKHLKQLNIDVEDIEKQILERTEAKKAENIEELKQAIEYASKYDTKILIEEEIIGREVECAVIGNTDVKATCVGEILPAEDFYTFDAKYNNAQSRVVIPAEVEKEKQEEIKKLAIKAFKAVDGKGLARVDFFIRKSDNKVCINEINTLPGFTQISMYPKLWEECGIPYSKLLDNLIELA